MVHRYSNTFMSKYDFDNKYFKECGLSQLNITRYLRMLIDYKT